MRAAIVFIAFLALADSQSVIVPDMDAFASSFLVKVHNATGNSFRCSGVLINRRHVLTVASGVRDLAPAAIRLHIGNTRLIGAEAVGVEQVIVHPNFNVANAMENNLAVLRIAQADANRTAGALFQPLPLGSLARDHFCSMYGFGFLHTPQNQGNERLHMSPALPLDAQQCDHLFRGSFFCALGTAGEFTQCGGFSGAAVICDGERISGLVFQEQFCGVNPRAYIVDLRDHHEWIGRVSSGGKALFSAVLVALCAVFTRLA